MAASYDGTTIAIGDLASSNAETTINGDVNDVSGSYVGSVHVFTYTGTSWNYDLIKASNAEDDDEFGSGLALSGDGNTLVVGAPEEDSSDQSTPSDNTLSGSGAAYVFTRDSGVWSQTAYLKASNLSSSAAFGSNVDISEDGETILVGAHSEDTTASSSGAAYVFQYGSGSWSEEAFLKAHNPTSVDFFGIDAALSADGNSALIGSYRESSDVSGIFPGTTEMGNENAVGSGAAYLFSRTGSSWNQDLFIKAPQPDGNDYFGFSLDISGNGDTIAVSSYQEDSLASGINGSETDNSGAETGAVFVYSNRSGSWQKEAYIKPNIIDNDDYFGRKLSLSDDGNTLATASPGEDGLSSGLNGDASDNSGSYPGAAYTFKRESGVWSQESYIKAPTTENGDDFGYGLALSGDGLSLLVGADEEDGGSTYEGGDQSDNTATDSGAVFLF